MMYVAYVVQSVAYALAGFLVGLLVGQKASRALEPEKAVTELPKRRRITSNGVIGFFLVLLGVVTAVQSITQNSATKALSECQIVYQNGFADALDARTNATQDAAEALDTLIGVIGDGISTAPTPERAETVRLAFQEYLARRAETKRTQQDNPYPAAPRDVCPEAA